MKSSILVALACLSLVACSRNVPTIATSVQQTGGCTIPPRTYDDLNACTGEAEEIEVDIADSPDGQTTAHIAIPSKDPQTILAAMGASMAERSVGAANFGVFAYGSREDYAGGVGWNRGRIYWNDGGAITVDICTEFETWSGIDVCVEESHFTVANR